ncbi:hypothetical protein FSARC_6182 [Fusarium sarcochroum]|uniref:chitin synthase n=1 Tax=Fusarium sarcochroum TaxID=1208366 RepID=A0A8H4TY69_9HYPO|nr:hypothetical protein FSARC_6182 [Fusarium sarcochroum]
MDPLSIASGCAGLIGAIGSLTISINTFVRTCREARSDLDRVSRELHSLQTVLELIQEDASDDTKSFPPTIQHHVSGIVSNCSSVVVEVQACITKYRDGRLKTKAAWTISGQGDMEKLRSSLEAHKSALELALDMLALSLTKDIKVDTTELRNDTAVIKDDTAHILHEIAQLQARLPDTAVAPNDYILQRFLEDMATYTEGTLDVDVGDSDCGSSRNLSLIDERTASPVGSPHENPPILAAQASKSFGTTQGLRSQAHEEPGITLPSTQACQNQTNSYRQRSSNEDLPQRPYNLEPDVPRSADPAHTPPQAQNSNAVLRTSPDQSYRPVKMPDTNDTSSSPRTLAPEETPDHPSKRSEERVPASEEYRISSFNGNVAFSIPVPDHIFKQVTRGGQDDRRHERANSRFTFVTCPPDQFTSQGYVLRQSLRKTPRRIKFILALQLDTHDKDVSFVSRWSMINEALLYAHGRLVKQGLTGNVWKQVLVHLHQPFAEKHRKTTSSGALRSIGASQDPDFAITWLDNDLLGTLVSPNLSFQLDGPKLTKNKYTVQLRHVSDAPIGCTVKSSLPIQVILTTPRVRESSANGSVLLTTDYMPSARAIEKAVQAEHVIDMGWTQGVSMDENRFLYEAWTTRKDLVKERQIGFDLQYIRLNDLIKQLRHRFFKERAASFARKFIQPS